MEMQQRITEFFQFIFEAFREEIPEFLVVAHEFRIRYALRNLNDPETAGILAEEEVYANKIKLLHENYLKVTQIIAVTPEPLKPAMLLVMGGSVQDMLEAMELEPQVVDTITDALEDILNDYDDVTTEETQQAGALLQQITAQQAGAANTAQEAPAETPVEETPVEETPADESAEDNTT